MSNLFVYYEVYNDDKEALFQSVKGNQTGEILVTEKRERKKDKGGGVLTT